MKMLALFFMLIVVTGCSSPYIGKTVNPNGSYLCNHRSLPAKCSTNTGQLVFQYEITPGSKSNEYFFKGKALASSIPGTWDYFKDARFTLYLVNDNVVTESFGMGGGRGTQGKDITFSRTFASEHEFDASLVGWSMLVRH